MHLHRAKYRAFHFHEGVLNKYVVVSRILDVDTPATKKEESDDHHDFHLTGDLKRVPVGSSVLAINGLCCSKLTVEELRGLLDSLPLPFTMRFSLLPEDPAKNRRQQMKPQPEFSTFTFRQEGPFGLRLRARPLATCGVIVVGFTAKSDGTKCPAELSGKIRIGQLLMKVNNVDLRFKTLSEVLAVLRELKSRPVTMQFATSPDAVIKLRDWPPMIEMEDASSFACDDEDDPPSTGRKYVVLSAFARVPSYAQRTHLVEKGDVLLQVNDTPLTGPDYGNFAEIMEALREIASKKEPMRCTFVSREDYIAVRKLLQQQRRSDSKRIEAPSSVVAIKNKSRVMRAKLKARRSRRPAMDPLPRPSTRTASTFCRPSQRKKSFSRKPHSAFCLATGKTRRSTFERSSRAQVQQRRRVCSAQDRRYSRCVDTLFLANPPLASSRR